jgi:hypothetical protein
MIYNEREYGMYTAKTPSQLSLVAVVRRDPSHARDAFSSSRVLILD